MPLQVGRAEPGLQHFGENFCERVGEFAIEHRNVGTFNHGPSQTLLIATVSKPTPPAAPSPLSDRHIQEDRVPRSSLLDRNRTMLFLSR